MNPPSVDCGSPLETRNQQRRETRVHSRGTHLQHQQQEQALSQTHGDTSESEEEGQENLPEPQAWGRGGGGGDLEDPSWAGYPPLSQTCDLGMRGMP